MTEFFSRVLNIAIPFFAVSSMAAVGFRYTFRQIAAPLRNIRGVLLALLANFVLVPLLAFLIVRLFSLKEPLAIGLILVASAAGAPFVLKLTQIAGGNLPFTAGILTILLIVTIAYMPFVVPRMGAGINVDAGAIARPLALTMLLPLTLALILENLWPGLGNRLDSALGILTNISLVAVVGLTVAVNLPAILGVFGTGAISAAVLLLIGAFVMGYVSGAFGRDTRDEVGLNTAQRNYAAAIVVASETFGNPDVLATVVVVSVISMLILFPAAYLLKKYSPQPAPKAVPIEISRRKKRAS